MSLTALITRTLLVAALVCVWTTQAKLQTENKSGGSTVRGTAVYSDTGRPLRHARVTLFGQGDGWQVSTGTDGTDLRGQFVFANVPAGKYLLTLDAPGLLKSESNRPRIDTLIPEPWYPEKREVDTEFVVNGTDSVELRVKAVRGGVITGRVVAEDDQPLINAEIKLLRRQNGKWAPVWSTWTSEREKAEHRTDASGVYRIAGLPSGQYLVRASEPFMGDDGIPGEEDAYSNGSFMVAYHPAAIRLKDAQAVQVVEGKESTGVDIRMTERAPHTLTGTVAFKAGEEARPSVEITIERSDEIGYTTPTRNATTRADKEGKWRVTGLPAGEYLVTIGGSALTLDAERGADFVQALRKRTTVRLGEDKVTVVNTTLTFGARVQGRITFNGKPPEGAWSITPAVELADNTMVSNRAKDELEDPSFHIGLVRGQGRFSINALPPGTYWFRFNSTEREKYYVKSVTRKGVDLMHAPFKLTEDLVFDDVVVTLAVDLARVEGQVTLPEGVAKELLRDVTVIVAPADEATNRFNAGTRTLQADSKGKIVFNSAPGEYFIAALTTADYKKIESEISNEYFKKNAGKFARIKLRAGEQTKGLPVPMMVK